MEPGTVTKLNDDEIKAIQTKNTEEQRTVVRLNNLDRFNAISKPEEPLAETSLAADDDEQ